MKNMGHFLTGLAILVVIYYALKFLLQELEPTLCAQGRMCADNLDTVLLVIFVVISLIFGYFRGKRKNS